MRLSVSASTMTAIPPGPYPSYTIVSNEAASLSCARAARDRALDVVLRHGVRARLLDRVLQREVAGGVGPPSFAATMIARESFEKSLPRFASAAPFLCLIDDHLLCPDTRLLPDQLQEPLVHARVVRQLRMERRDEEAPVAHEHRLALVLGEHLDVRRRPRAPAARG